MASETSSFLLELKSALRKIKPEHPKSGIWPAVQGKGNKQFCGEERDCGVQNKGVLEEQCMAHIVYNNEAQETLIRSFEKIIGLKSRDTREDMHDVRAHCGEEKDKDLENNNPSSQLRESSTRGVCNCDCKVKSDRYELCDDGDGFPIGISYTQVKDELKKMTRSDPHHHHHHGAAGSLRGACSAGECADNNASNSTQSEQSQNAVSTQSEITIYPQTKTSTGVSTQNNDSSTMTQNIDHSVFLLNTLPKSAEKERSPPVRKVLKNELYEELNSVLKKRVEDRVCLNINNIGKARSGKSIMFFGRKGTRSSSIGSASSTQSNPQEIDADKINQAALPESIAKCVESKTVLFPNTACKPVSAKTANQNTMNSKIEDKKQGGQKWSEGAAGKNCDAAPVSCSTPRFSADPSKVVQSGVTCHSSQMTGSRAEVRESDTSAAGLGSDLAHSCDMSEEQAVSCEIHDDAAGSCEIDSEPMESVAAICKVFEKSKGRLTARSGPLPKTPTWASTKHGTDSCERNVEEDSLPEELFHSVLMDKDLETVESPYDVIFEGESDSQNNMELFPPKNYDHESQTIETEFTSKGDKSSLKPNESIAEAGGNTQNAHTQSTHALSEVRVPLTETLHIQTCDEGNGLLTVASRFAPVPGRDVTELTSGANHAGCLCAHEEISPIAPRTALDFLNFPPPPPSGTELSGPYEAKDPCDLVNLNSDELKFKTEDVSGTVSKETTIPGARGIKQEHYDSGCVTPSSIHNPASEKLSRKGSGVSDSVKSSDSYHGDVHPGDLVCCLLDDMRKQVGNLGNSDVTKEQQYNCEFDNIGYESDVEMKSTDWSSSYSLGAESVETHSLIEAESGETHSPIGAESGGTHSLPLLSKKRGATKLTRGRRVYKKRHCNSYDRRGSKGSLSVKRNPTLASDASMTTLTSNCNSTTTTAVNGYPHAIGRDGYPQAIQNGGYSQEKLDENIKHCCSEKTLNKESTLEACNCLKASCESNEPISGCACSGADTNSGGSKSNSATSLEFWREKVECGFHCYHYNSQVCGEELYQKFQTAPHANGVKEPAVTAVDPPFNTYPLQKGLRRADGDDGVDGDAGTAPLMACDREVITHLLITHSGDRIPPDGAECAVPHACAATSATSATAAQQHSRVVTVPMPTSFHRNASNVGGTLIGNMEREGHHGNLPQRHGNQFDHSRRLSSMHSSSQHSEQKKNWLETSRESRDHHSPDRQGQHKVKQNSLDKESQRYLLYHTWSSNAAQKAKHRGGRSHKSKKGYRCGEPFVLDGTGSGTCYESVMHVDRSLENVKRAKYRPNAAAAAVAASSSSSSSGVTEALDTGLSCGAATHVLQRSLSDSVSVQSVCTYVWDCTDRTNVNVIESSDSSFHTEAGLDLNDAFCDAYERSLLDYVRTKDIGDIDKEIRSIRQQAAEGAGCVPRSGLMRRLANCFICNSPLSTVSSQSVSRSSSYRNPITQNIVDSGSGVTVYGDGLSKAEVGKQARFYIDSKGHRGEITHYQVDGPNSYAKCHIEPEGSGRYIFSYVPLEVGPFTVMLKWNNRELSGSPYRVRVVDTRNVRVMGGWESHLDANRQMMLAVNQTKRMEFDVSGAGPGHMTAEIQGPGGVTLPTYIDQRDNFVTLTFTPNTEGAHFVKINWSDIPLPNSPFQGIARSVLKQINHEKVILTGRGLKEARVKEEAEFVIDGTEAGPGQPQVTLTGVKSDIEVRVASLGDNKYRCSYVAQLAGAYLLNIMWSDRQVKGSPFKVNAIATGDASKVVAIGEGLKMGIMGREIKATIDTRRAGPGELTAQCNGPSKVAYCELFDHRDGTFTLSVKPQEPGRHLLQIKYGGEHVPGSPFTLKISGAPDASKVKVRGPGIEPGILAVYQSRFICETKGAGAGQLTVRIRGPKGAFRVEMLRDSQKDRTIQCRYDPTEVGDYVVSVRWSGEHVPGSPFHVQIFDTKAELDHFLAKNPSRRTNAISGWQDTF